MHERAHPAGFRWVHDSFGTNWRMLEMQAVIGRIQLRKMPIWTGLRQANAEQISQVCKQHAVVRVPPVPVQMQHAYYKYYLFVEPQYLAESWSRDRIIQEIAALGVPCLHGTCPEVYLEKAFDHTPGRPAQRLKVAQELGETSIMFLIHPTLTAAEMQKTCAALDAVLTMATTKQRHAA